MLPTLTFLGLFGLLQSGFFLMALSQRRHRHAVYASGEFSPAVTLAIRRLGFLLLAAAAIGAIWRDGVGFGLLLWACTLSVTALATAATLAFKPGILRPLARVLAKKSNKQRNKARAA